MKKVILAIVTMLAATTLATAQMRPTIKVEAGANFANQTTKVGKDSEDGKMMIGYRAGVGIEFGIKDGFYVNPGVYFLSRGQKTSELEFLGAKGNVTRWLHNVEIPVHVGYRASVAPGMAVSIQAGPWFSYAFLGKDTFAASGSGLVADAAKVIVEKINKMDNNPYKDKGSFPIPVGFVNKLKPFDLGVGMQAGFEYQQLGVNLGFEYGLLNTSAFKNTKVNNMNFYVGLGYRF